MMRNQGLWFVFPVRVVARLSGQQRGPGAHAECVDSARCRTVGVGHGGRLGREAAPDDGAPWWDRRGAVPRHRRSHADRRAEGLAHQEIEATLKADDEGIRTAMKAFRADLLAGVKAGKIDTAKMTADDAVVDKAIANHQDKEATALDSLYKLLDAGQRTTVVAAVRAKQAERETRMANWNKESDGGAPDWSKKRLDKLTADLALDAGQQKQVAAILAKTANPPNAAGMQSRWDDMKKRQDALLTAFASPTFDAKKADLTVLPGKSAHDPMDHMAAFFTQLLPVLHADQRDKLVASMDRPFGAHEGPPGMSGQGMPHHPVDDIAFPFVEPGEGSGEAPAPPK